MRSAGPIIALTIAVWPQLVAGQAAPQSEPVTNIEIRLLKTSTRPPLRITAETRNPNDFAVRDIEVTCTIKDKAGRDLATSTTTILHTLPPNHRLVTKGLDIGAWPPKGYAGLCVSKRAVRVANPVLPPQSQLPTAPQPANAGR